MATTTTKKTTTPAKKVNYNFDSTKETASQYNQRVAKERGDSSSELKSMQKATSSAFSSKGLDPNKLTVVTSANTKPDAPITLPTQSTLPDMSMFTDTANAALAATSGGTYDTTTKQIVSAPTSTEPNQFQSYVQQLLGSNKQNFETNIDGMNERNMRAEQKTLRPKENLVNSLQGQINTITSRRDQEILKLEGQGRGQTEGFIGGEQARIGREAAIQAMPIQAQLAIAQDDLESARSYASQLFQAQSQDALARYNYQKDVNNAIFTFLNQEQQRILETKQRAEDKAFQVEQTNRNNLKQISMQAIEYGQGALAGEFMRIDPASPTYEADVSDAMSRLRKPMPIKSVEYKNYGTTENPMWGYIDANNNFVPVSGINGGTQGTTPAKQSEILSNLSLVDEIINSPVKNQVFGLKNPFTYWTPGTNEQYVKNQVSQLKANLSLENRQKLKGSGAISDFEAKTLERASSAIGTNLSDKDAQKELVKIRGVFQTAAGQPALVKITDPLTGKSQLVNATREGINQALMDGALVEYQ